MKNHTKKEMKNSEEINEEEVFEKKESKVKTKLQKLLKNKVAMSILIVVLVAIVLVVLEVTTGVFSGLLTQNQVGNSQGNIINCGYSLEKNGYLYYVSPSENMAATQISRVKLGSNESEVIYQGNYDIRGLNLVGNKLYFISISVENAPEDDGVDNKIYQMNLDGSGLTVINDNDFTYDSYDLHIVKNTIYYVGNDFHVYQMDLKGGNRKLVAETGTGYLTMNEKYIIYDKNNEDGTDYVTYIRPLDGTDEKPINSSRIFMPMLEKDFIYYINQAQHLARIPVAGGEEQVLSEAMVYNMNVANGKIYYLGFVSEEAENEEEVALGIFAMDLEGGEPQKLKELSSYTSFLNVVDDYMYYMDMDDEKAFINLVNTNDLSEIKLYEWSYQDYLEE